MRQKARKLRFAFVTVAAFIATSALACRNAEKPPRDSAPATRPDIVLITVDTLRADRVGRGLTPAIDGLAARGVRFTNARATAPLTLPSHVSIMTGLLPPAHGVRENGVVFRPRQPTLARAFRDAGYRTAAFVGAYVLDARFGVADGFEQYDDRVPRDPDAAERLEAERRGSEVVDAALGWLQAAPSPYFLWVHLYDPHAPYEPPPDYLAGARGVAYDGEIAYADAQIARVVRAIGARGTDGSTLFVVTGDHGEGLGEHGERTHGMLAYDTTLRVPLVIAGPGVARAAVAAPVSLIDVAPSLRRRAGLAPAAGAPGADLFSAPAADRDVYSETQYPRAAGWHPLAVLAGDRWKLILSSERELYNVAVDPEERSNLAGALPAVVEGMASRIRQLEAAAPQLSTAVAADAAERLRALGYVSGGSAPVDSAAPNPASAIASWDTFEAALAQVTANRAHQALPALRNLAARFPRSTVFQSTYARALMEAGQPKAAVDAYRSAIARSPRDAALFHDLAAAARAAGDRAEALRAEQAALALDKDSPAALNGLGLLHADAGRAADAAAAFQRAAEIDPGNASYWTNLGNARRELGDRAAAEAAYRRALDADPAFADALNGIGVILVQRGAAAQAVPFLTRALERAPDFHEARLNLGIAYQEGGDNAKAAIEYRRLLATAPRSAARERNAAAALLKKLGAG